MTKKSNDSATNDFPAVLLIKDKAAPSAKERAMFAYALMHLENLSDGHIDIASSDFPVGNGFSLHSLPPTFEEFWAVVSTVDAFCSQVFIPQEGSAEERMLLLMSEGYDPNYAEIFTEANLILHGDNSWSFAELQDVFYKDLMPLVDKIAHGELLPIRIYVNPDYASIQNYAALRVDKADKNGKIHVPAHSRKSDGMKAPCFRSDFRFFCTRDIYCCGTCPIMEKAYNILINEALDEESAARLTQIVEDAGLFGMELEDGRHVCENYSDTCDMDECLATNCYIAGEEIRRYWSECFA